MSQSGDFPPGERPPMPSTAQDAAVGGRETHTPFRQPQLEQEQEQEQLRSRSNTSSSRTSIFWPPAAAGTGSSNHRPPVTDRSDDAKRIRSDSHSVHAAGPVPRTKLAGDIALASPDQHSASSTRTHGQSAASSSSPAPQSAPPSSRDMRDNSQEAVTPPPAGAKSSEQQPGSAAASAADMPANAAAAASTSSAAAAEDAAATSERSKSPGNIGSHDRDSSAQKRRLNQACLLCRRKKIRCDSVHPSCSNCQRRGIQCIYPEVRKRGRPPRMYTFADFALPGQPLPPELQNMANVHASAMLPTSGAQGQQSANAGASAGTHGWSAGASVAS
ncbi:hypothetical protein IWW50_005592, partial [Coemansia erecta]